MKKRLFIIFLTLWFLSSFLSLWLSVPFDLSKSNALGFDSFGRNVLFLTLQGSALSSLIAFAVGLITTAIAIFLSSLLSFSPIHIRKYLDGALDMILAFPFLLLALTFAILFGPGWKSLTFALLLDSLPSLTRLMQNRTLEVKSKDFVLSAESIGASPQRILIHHILPELSDTIAAKFPALFAHLLLAETSLTFLGIGAPLGTLTWGAILQQSQELLLEAPHIAVISGLPLFLTCLSLQNLAQKRFMGYN